MKKHIYNIAAVALMMGVSACSFEDETTKQRIAEHFEYQHSGLDEEGGFDDSAKTKRASAKMKLASKKARKKTFKDDESFETASVSDDTLSGMRGGFISVSGLKINFGLYSQTLVNNNIVSNLTVSTNGLNGILPGNLQQLIQAGSGNQAPVSSSAVPVNVLTVVQNTTDNQIIQNANVLDITVSNISAYRDQQIGNNIRFVTIGGR